MKSRDFLKEISKINYDLKILYRTLLKELYGEEFLDSSEIDVYIAEIIYLAESQEVRGPMSVRNSLNKIAEANSKIRDLYKETINELFLDTEIKQFSIDVAEEYDDNNYYTQVSLIEVNDVELPERITDSWILDNINRYPDWSTFLMASKVKQESLRLLLEIMNTIPSDYFESQPNNGATDNGVKITFKAE